MPSVFFIELINRNQILQLELKIPVFMPSWLQSINRNLIGETQLEMLLPPFLMLNQSELHDWDQKRVMLGALLFSLYHFVILIVIHKDRYNWKH
jgi:hypothetical protein